MELFNIVLWAHFDLWRHTRRRAHSSGQAFFPGAHLYNGLFSQQMSVLMTAHQLVLITIFTIFYIEGLMCFWLRLQKFSLSAHCSQHAPKIQPLYLFLSCNMAWSNQFLTEVLKQVLDLSCYFFLGLNLAWTMREITANKAWVTCRRQFTKENFQLSITTKDRYIFYSQFNFKNIIYYERQVKI